MTEREAERRRFGRWLRGAEPATEAEARAKGERLRRPMTAYGQITIRTRELDRECKGRLPQFWWQRRRTPGG